MPVEVEINGTRAVVSNGVWQSQDRATQQMLSAVCEAQLLTQGYAPDIDLASSRIAQEQLGARVVHEDLPEETYPADAVF